MDLHDAAGHISNDFLSDGDATRREGTYATLRKSVRTIRREGAGLLAEAFAWHLLAGRVFLDALPEESRVRGGDWVGSSDGNFVGNDVFAQVMDADDVELSRDKAITGETPALQELSSHRCE